MIPVVVNGELGRIGDLVPHDRVNHLQPLPRHGLERLAVRHAAFFMRHRILECTSKNMSAFRSAAGDGMEIDECCLRESFKGNRKNAACGIPRKAHHQPHAIDQYEQICVLTGINDAGDFFFEMAGPGNITEGCAEAFLEGFHGVASTPGYLTA